MEGRETAIRLTRRRTGGFAVVAALSLLALAAAGCTSPQTVSVRVREGDFLELDLAAWDPQGREVLNLSAYRAVASSQVPARVPEGWDPNQTGTLPPGVVRALVGLAPGATLETRLLPPSEAFGEWSEDRAIRAPRLQEVPRELSGAELAPCDTCGDHRVKVRWAGNVWDAELIERGPPPRVRLLVAPEHMGRLLELPDYWSERYQLWRSRLVNATDEALIVQHFAEEGRTVLVGGLAYRVAVRPDEVLADGNHPLAGQALRFRVLLHRVAFPGSAEFPVAPDSILVTTEGRRFNLSDLRGRPVLLDFYATWCVTCKQQAPALARAHAEFGDRVAVVSVSIDPTDTADRVEKFKADAGRASLAAWGRELPINWTFASDPAGQAVLAFSVTGIPREVVLDGDGRIRATRVGLQPWPDLRDELLAVLEA